MTHEVRIPVWQRLGHAAATAVAVAAMLVVGFAYGVSGLMVTEWLVVALAVVWLGLAVVGVVLARRRSYGVLLVPPIAAVVWVATVLVTSLVRGA
jgi:hypothetical protein